MRFDILTYGNFGCDRKQEDKNHFSTVVLERFRKKRNFRIVIIAANKTTCLCIFNSECVCWDRNQIIPKAAHKAQDSDRTERRKNGQHARNIKNHKHRRRMPLCGFVSKSPCCVSVFFWPFHLISSYTRRQDKLYAVMSSRIWVFSFRSAAAAKNNNQYLLYCSSFHFFLSLASFFSSLKTRKRVIVVATRPVHSHK